jgi:uncharacterized metal-binding protein YceD (DUF177 family)
VTGWPHPVPVVRLAKGAQVVQVRADAARLGLIAEALGVPRVERFEADAELGAKRRRYTVAGEVRARLWQTCVVTLEDFPVDIVAPIDAAFADPEDLPAPTRSEVERSLDDEDPPEPVENGVIDVGRLAVEFVALALDPFPRKPDAVLAADGAGDAASADDTRAGPFAALGALKGIRT